MSEQTNHMVLIHIIIGAICSSMWPYQAQTPTDKVINSVLKVCDKITGNNPIATEQIGKSRLIFS